MFRFDINIASADDGSFVVRVNATEVYDARRTMTARNAPELLTILDDILVTNKNPTLAHVEVDAINMIRERRHGLAILDSPGSVIEHS